MSREMERETRGKISQKGALRAPDRSQKLMVMATYGPDMS
jgi:hypothetical protein